MATVYRDYGAMNYLQPANNEINSTPRRQVYQATHGGDGSRLPYMNRSFISFTYGGKPIEDFDLIATIVSNRLDRSGYAPFNDITSQYDNLNGQYYWNSHYNANQLSLTLSTDGIDQPTLDEFLFWFHAGEARELILSEHPNRAIMARVSSPPKLSLLPFEYDTTITISSIQYPTKTTLYKGDITIDFVMDEPHWYAIQNILGREDTSRNRIVDEWVDANGNTVEVFASKDALKILVEDGIPLGSMIDNNMLLGNGAFANVENNTDSLIWSLPEAEIEKVNAEPTGVGARIYGTITDEEYADRSRLVVATEALQWLAMETTEELWYDKEPGFEPDHREYHPGQYKGIIAGPIIDISGKGIESLAYLEKGYFFYSGTAPSPTIISFDVTPKFNDYGYFSAINNTFINPTVSYNIITVESVNKQELRFTTPNLITSYNTALDLLIKGIQQGKANVDIQDDILKKVRHPAVRTWVNSLISTSANLTGVPQETIKDRMTQFFMNDEDEFAQMHFSFNSKTGEAIANFEYRRPTQQLSLFDMVYEENALNKVRAVTERDNNLTDIQRYENLVTWGWEQYCLDNEGVLIVPDPEDETSYTVAATAFKNYYSLCRQNGISMPGIFTVNARPRDLSTLIHATEDVGDMLKSNNIVIVDRNYPNENGKVVHWENTIKGKTYSHRIYHDLSDPISNLQIQYRNMYL